MVMIGYGELVLLRKGDGMGVITLNRPEKRNALSRALQLELRAALEDACADCRALVITGAGVAFCAGVDLAEQRERREQGTERVYAHGGNMWVETNELIRRHPAIMIAAVNGFALGGGLTLIHNCELAIASERAEFGMPEMGFGTFPGLAGPATIRRILPKHAAYMILTARRISAETGARWGIVNTVVPHERLLEEAEALARHVAQFDPVVLDYSKKAIRELDLMPWSEGIGYGGYVNSAIREHSQASREGVNRFLSGQRNPGQGADAEKA
ncbi:MAG TPA: enoyl-CoA hydratase/isomerase family protein [bacterium]|nr:enoyl-CoA hydratase/isomerase family protein [bacterium]